MTMSVSHVRAVALLLLALLTLVSGSDVPQTSIGAAAPGHNSTSIATATPTSPECSIARDSQTLITNAAQASSLAAACPLFTGTINLDAPGEVAFDGITLIDGDFITGANSSISAISSNSIRNITGTLSLTTLANLTAFNFPNLLSVGILQVYDLPSSVKTLSFLDTLQDADAIDFQSTALSGLDGFNLRRVGSVNIKDNSNMASVNLQMTNATNVFIGGNSAQMDVCMPNLAWVHNLTLANCSGASIPALMHVNDTLHLTGNSFTTFGNPSVVRTIDNELWINNNMNLTNISLPELRSVGGHVLINNNPKLSVLDEIIVLENIGGSVQMDGGFSSISFPALANVSGGFALNSTINLDCAVFDTYYRNGIIVGNYTCTTPSSSDSSDSSTDKTKNGTIPAVSVQHHSSNRVKIGVGVGVPLGCLAIAALAALYFMHHVKQGRRKSGKKNNISEMPATRSIAEIDGGSKKFFYELGRSHSRNASGPESRHELHSDTLPAELVTPVEDDSHYMDVIIGNFELEGDTVYAHKPEDWA